jgi:hypothetical protein
MRAFRLETGLFNDPAQATCTSKKRQGQPSEDVSCCDSSLYAAAHIGRPDTGMS